MNPEQSPLPALFERRMGRRTALKIIGGSAAAAIVGACSAGATLIPTPGPTTPGPTSPTTPGATPGPTTSGPTAPPASAPPTGNVISGTINGDLLPSLPRGGHVVLSMQTPDALTSLTNTATATAEAAGPVHDTLEAFDYQKVLRPSLAEKLEIPDSTTLRYTLHEGATFHDGRPVTSTVVKELVTWVQDPANNSWIGDPLKGVTVETPDARTVVVKLDKPNAGIRRSLVHLPIVPVDSIPTQGSSPMGCGPYIFEEYVRDSHLAFRANPNYRNPDAPRLETLRHTHYADSTAGLQAFLAGETDYTRVWAAGMVPEFQARAEAGEFKTYVGSVAFTYLAFNCEKPPYDDPRVRKAFRLAIDRAPLADVPFGGLAEPWPIPMSPAFPYYPKDLEAELLVRDTDEAKRLLSEAGVAPGFSDKLLVVNIGYPEAQGLILQDQLAQIGLQIDVEVMDQPTLIDRRGKGDFGILLLGNIDDPEPTAYLARHFRTGTTWADKYRYSNPECDRLLDAAAATFDETERKALYRDALRIALIDDTAMVSFCPEATLYAYKNSTNAEQFGPPQNFKFEVVARSAS